MSIATAPIKLDGVGGLFRRCRLEAGISRKELAFIIHCSIQAIEAFENGRRPAPQGGLEFMAERHPTFARELWLRSRGFNLFAAPVLNGPKVDHNPIAMFAKGEEELDEIRAVIGEADLINKLGPEDLSERDRTNLGRIAQELLDIGTWSANTFDELARRFGLDRASEVTRHRAKLIEHGYTEATTLGAQ